MRTTLLAALLVTWSLPAPAGAVWGQKSRSCPRLESQLVALEQNGADPESPRLRRLRQRVDNKCVALNEIQVLSSHNSYHIQPKPALLALLEQFDPTLISLEYTHPPLDEQFSNEGIRHIELDVYADPDGGLYDLRRGLILIGEDPESGIPELKQPGFKVLHVQDVDFDTNCVTFVECLKVVKAWSDGHRGHLPIAIQVETEEDPIPDPVNLGFTVPLPIGPAEFDALDAEIHSVFPDRQLVTPDDVRRGLPTLEEAVLTLGWPKLGSLRGKVLFLLDNEGKRDTYIAGHPSLQGRAIFTNSTPGEPDAAFVKLNDPFDPSIPTVVSAGYLVRTRADVDTIEARTGNTAPRDTALASGAHFVSTDYPVPDTDPGFDPTYFVQIPGGTPGRCNAVHTAVGCRTEGLEVLR